MIHRSHYCDVDYGVDDVGTWALKKTWPRALPAVYALSKYLTCKKISFSDLVFLACLPFYVKGAIDCIRRIRRLGNLYIHTPNMIPPPPSHHQI